MGVRVEQAGPAVVAPWNGIRPVPRRRSWRCRTSGSGGSRRRRPSCGPVRGRPNRAELITACREMLTPYEVPVHVAVVDALPRTPSSKVSRAELLELVPASPMQDRD
jgi:acyl-CoA synthetase (AMP-forming)/AMP-acid ligase II